MLVSKNPFMRRKHLSCPETPTPTQYVITLRLSKDLKKKFFENQYFFNYEFFERFMKISFRAKFSFGHCINWKNELLSFVGSKK